MYIGQDVKRAPAWIRVLVNGKPFQGAHAAYAIQVQPGKWTEFGGEVPSDAEGMIHFDDIPVQATVDQTVLPVQKVRYQVAAPGHKPVLVDVDPAKMPKVIDVALKPEGFKLKWWHVAAPVGGVGLVVLIARLVGRKS